MQERISREKLEDYMFRAMRKRDTLFMAFIINVGLMLLFWLVSLTDFYAVIWLHFLQFTEARMQLYTYGVLGAWQTLNIVLNLSPALAKWWDMSMIRKHSVR